MKCMGELNAHRDAAPKERETEMQTKHLPS